MWDVSYSSQLNMSVWFTKEHLTTVLFIISFLYTTLQIA